jgi:hypothetical protein
MRRRWKSAPYRARHSLPPVRSDVSDDSRRWSDGVCSAWDFRTSHQAASRRAISPEAAQPVLAEAPRSKRPGAGRNSHPRVSAQGPPRRRHCRRTATASVAAAGFVVRRAAHVGGGRGRKRLSPVTQKGALAKKPSKDVEPPSRANPCQQVIRSAGSPQQSLPRRSAAFSGEFAWTGNGERPNALPVSPTGAQSHNPASPR